MFTLEQLLGTPDVGAALEGMGIDEPAGACLEVVGYPSGSPATAALYRLRAGGQSLFCKVLQHVRHWPSLRSMPPHIVDDFIAELPWRVELELWEPWHLATLPEGLRAAELLALVEMPDERAAVWMEDVDEIPGPWPLTRYERAAYLLGRWNARTTAPEVLAHSTLPRGYALRMYGENAVTYRGLMPLADDGLWEHPWLAGHADLRAELRSLGDEIPSMLDRMDTHPQCLPHGDASPQNLLVPADEPDGFVVIDLSFRSPHAIGFDLGQLLVGLVHAGQLPAARMPEVAAAIGPAYVEGLHAEGVQGRDAEALDAFATGVMLRSGFDGLLLELLEESADSDRPAFDDRIEMTRVLVELYRSR